MYGGQREPEQNKNITGTKCNKIVIRFNRISQEEPARKD